MRLTVVCAALAAACVMAPVGSAPASAQDFSITNPEAPGGPGRRDVMRQLQAWWDLHAFYPKHASNRDEGGTVKIHLLIYPDGRIWTADVVESSGSSSLDAAAAATFRGGFITKSAEGAPDANIDLSLHYVLAHRHDQPVAAGTTPAASAKRPFTITNDPVTSPILETMLQRICTGTVVKEGVRNYPAYGVHQRAQAVFFRKPDGTPWVKYYDGGQSLIAPVTEAGKMVQWTGQAEYARKTVTLWYQFTVWADGDNTLSGNIEAHFFNENQPQGINTGGTVDFTCASETVPAIAWTALSISPLQVPSIDPP